MVFDAKFEFVLDEEEEEVEEHEEDRGCSFASRRSVSAATMPPMEWPIKIVCTDGSTVGDGVECATSMSITLF